MSLLPATARAGAPAGDLPASLFAALTDATSPGLAAQSPVFGGDVAGGGVARRAILAGWASARPFAADTAFADDDMPEDALLTRDTARVPALVSGPTIARRPATYHLDFDLLTETDPLQIATGAQPGVIVRRLDLVIGHLWRRVGRLRLSIDYENGSPTVSDPTDFIAHANDHSSLSVEHEHAIGASLAVDLPWRNRVALSGGVVDVQLRDHWADSLATPRAGELTGWRGAVRAEHFMGRYVLAAEYRFTNLSAGSITAMAPAMPALQRQFALSLTIPY